MPCLGTNSASSSDLSGPAGVKFIPAIAYAEPRECADALGDGKHERAQASESLCCTGGRLGSQPSFLAILECTSYLPM